MEFIEKKEAMWYTINVTLSLFITKKNEEWKKLKGKIVGNL